MAMRARPARNDSKSFCRDAVAVDAVVVREVVEERGDRVVRGHAAKIEARRLHFALVDLPRVAVLRQVALRARRCGRRNSSSRLRPETFSASWIDARGVVQHLHGLDAGDVVEEPAAARVHEHGVALHLQQLEHA